MAKFLTCPGCEASVDISPFKPGALVACPGCDAAIKVPGGAPKAAKPAPPPPPRMQRQTALMRKVSGARQPGSGKGPPRPHRMRPASKSNTGLVVGICVGVGAVLIVVIAVASNSGNKEEPKKKPPAAEAAVEPPPVEAAAPPGGFEKGGLLMIGKDAEVFVVDDAKDKLFREKALAGKYADLITPADAMVNFQLSLKHLVGDDEALARAGWGYIETFTTDPKITKGQKLKKAEIPGDFNKASMRAKFYGAWAEFAGKKKTAEITARILKGEDVTKPPEDDPPAGAGTAGPGGPAKAAPIDDTQWENMTLIIKTGAREGEHGALRRQAVQKILSSGKPGIKRLIDQITKDDVGLAQGSVIALNDILEMLPPERGGGKERRTDVPNAASVEAVREQWLEWFKRDYKD
jgi:hypothetical protein